MLFDYLIKVLGTPYRVNTDPTQSKAMRVLYCVT